MKYDRPLKVSEYRSEAYQAKPAPYIRMIGYWLEQAGFSVGEHINVEVDKGRLVITKNSLEERITGDQTVE